MLNDLQIKALKATGKRYEITCGNGLYLDVTPTGSKIWRFRYRLHGQREKVTIGPYPAIGLKDANARHLDLAAMVAKGKSPAREQEREKQRADEARTIEELAKLYRADLSQRSKNTDAGRGWIFDAYIIPKIGRYPLVDITPTDVLRFLDGIKGTAPASAIAVHGTLKRMFDFAIARQVMIINPAAAIPSRAVGEKKARTRALDPREIGQLLRSLDSAKGEAETINAFRLLLLTMVRREELLQAIWVEFNLDSALWTIPGERTKNGKAHVVPLSSQAVEILLEQKENTGGMGLVLPGRTSGKPLSTGTLHESMKRNSSFGIAAFTPHDFRRTASTILHEQGWNSDVIEKALNHTMRGVRGIYNKAEYLDQRREMLQAWGGYVMALKEGAKIVPIGTAKSS
ncbi:MAG: tyrosine-type recombinase/integrase [Gammaproteobacteria bacterium]|nr:tyrosine-type recombinase/integrase [Gammaproteobacteria bacterium]MBU1602543.1 tyrosine-type recombinase/integrase [Gammaproteobacteria bacterium]MBU2433348.1 tyrosine-type recombinase/integrase [Gammaproteobacteria bacterium]MBU2451264.1 tyrosine-type recombinase/integrase [Gammaproteobacteria bacterium]